MKLKKLKFLNVVDDRWPERRMTILYDRELRPYEGGFCYSFDYSTGGGVRHVGTGIVSSGRYAGMSSEEIEFVCSVENPVTREDIYDTCIRSEMVPEYARKYADAERKKP